MEHTVDEELLTMFKERFKKWGEVDFACCDPNVLPILKKLNTVDGLATVWSCEGHPEKKAPGENRFYIMFAANANGMRFLERVYSSLKYQLRRTRFPVNTLALAFTSRDFPDIGDRWYNATILGANLKEENKGFFLELLDTVVDMQMLGGKVPPPEWNMMVNSFNEVVDSFKPDSLKF